MSSIEYDSGVQDGSQRAVSDVLDVIDEHIPSLTEDDEEEMDLLIDGNREYDWADFARRTCACGDHIDGFYGYLEHLKSAIKRALFV
jgi:hypothetical protein